MNDKQQKYDRKLGNGGMTLQEVADTLGVSRERVRQIERKALFKVRRRLAAMGILTQDMISND